jgi:homoserine O-succinyltransferase
MPIKVDNNLPAKRILEDENIFIMDEGRAITQDIRPLEILILNLMPIKEDTEVALMRALSNTPLQVNINFMTTESYVGHTTPKSHLDKFYINIEDVKDKKFDGLIVTGAPVEQLPYEDVVYWNELSYIFDWSKDHVTSSIFICWGAMAGLYHFYGIDKYDLPKKLFGIYAHHVYERKVPLVRGFDDIFYAPHSRHTSVRREDIEREPDLTILAESEEAGVFLCMSNDSSRIFVLGHPEYDRMTLDKEYRRDKAKGLPIDIPVNYYPGDDPDKRPILSWRAHANTFYTNWLNYYVYQNTPYRL